MAVIWLRCACAVVWSCIVALWVEVSDISLFFESEGSVELLLSTIRPTKSSPVLHVFQFTQMPSRLCCGSVSTSAVVPEAERNCSSVQFTQMARQNTSKIPALKGLCEQGFDVVECHTASSFVPDMPQIYMAAKEDILILVKPLRPCPHIRKQSLFPRLPQPRFKDICVHTDPLKTTENAVVHIPGL